MTKTDWACATAAAIIGGSLIAFQFSVLLKDKTPYLICKHTKEIVMCGLPGGKLFPND